MELGCKTLFEAELKHKLPELKAREDYLTSCIFGVLKYLPPNEALFPFLNSSFNYRLNVHLENYLELQNRELTSFDKVRFHFWPRSSIYGEPDLIITLQGPTGSFLISIEIKYFSQKHGEEEEDQLRRYYVALTTAEGRRTFNQEAVRGFSGELLAFIYVTQFEAESEIEETLRILKTEGVRDAETKFFHLRWQEISRVIDRVLLKEQDYYKKRIYSDIKDLIIFKNLLPFTRFSELPVGLSSELLLQISVFIEFEDTKYKGFTKFSDLPKQISPELLSHFPIYSNLQNTKDLTFFNGFPEIPDALTIKYKTNIYITEVHNER